MSKVSAKVSIKVDGDRVATAKVAGDVTGAESGAALLAEFTAAIEKAVADTRVRVGL